MTFDSVSLSTKSNAMRKTAYIRFDLAERLQVVNYVNLIISLVLTVYLSGWAVFTAFFPEFLNESEGKTVSYVAVMATIALMCLTILEYMADRSVKARAFLQCGNRILKVADDLDYHIECGHELSVIKTAIDSYHCILSESEWNHSGEDFRLYALKQHRNASFCKGLQYYAALINYYTKRLLLQIILAAAVIFATYTVTTGSV